MATESIKIVIEASAAQAKAVLESLSSTMKTTMGGMATATRPMVNATQSLTTATTQASKATQEHSGHMGAFRKSTVLAIVEMMALYSIMRLTIGGIKTLFTDAFNAVEDYRMAIIKISALYTTFSEKSKFDLAGAYKEASTYAKDLVSFLEVIDKRMLTNITEALSMVEVMSAYGITLDMNNKKAVEGFISVGNAVKTVSAQYQNAGVQIRQELRGLFTGQTREVDQLAKMVDQRLGGSLKENIKQWREAGTLWENLGKLLEGFGAASKDFENTWEAIGSSLKTLYTKTLRQLFVPTFELILEKTKEINEYFESIQGARWLDELSVKLENTATSIANFGATIWENRQVYMDWLTALKSFAGIVDTFIITPLAFFADKLAWLASAIVDVWNKWKGFVDDIESKPLFKEDDKGIEILHNIITKIKEFIGIAPNMDKAMAFMEQRTKKGLIPALQAAAEAAEKTDKKFKELWGSAFYAKPPKMGAIIDEEEAKKVKALLEKQAKAAEEYLKKYAMDNADLHEKLALQRNEDLKKVGNNAKAKEAIWATYYKKVNDLDQNFHMSIDISDRFSIVKLQDTLDESVNRFSVSKEKMKEISEKTDFSITGHTANLQLQVDQTLYDSAIDLSQKLLDEKIDKLNKNREINMATNLEILKSDKATAGEKMKAMEELNQNLNSSNMNLMQSFKLGWKSAEENWHSTTLLMAEMGYDFADKTRDYIGNYLFEGLKGHMRSFSDFWTGFWKMLRDIFLKTIAQMVADAIMLKIGLQDIIGSVLGAIGLGGGGGGGTAKNIVSVAAGALLPKISLGGEGGGVSIGGAGAGAGLFGGNLVDIAYSVADAVSSLGIGAVSDAAYAIADQLAIVEESLGASLGGLVTAGGLGFIGGNIISKLFGKRGPAGGIGGATGAMAGMAIGGPIGAILGGIGGSLLGALGFGKNAPSVFEGLGIKATDESRGIQALDASIRALVDGSLGDFKVGLTVIAEALDDTINRVNYGKVNFGEFEGVMQTVGSASERYLNILKEQTPTSDMANASAKQLIASIVVMAAQTQNATGVTLEYRTKLMDMALALLQNASQSGFTAAQVQYLTTILNSARAGAFDFGATLEWLNSIQLAPKTINVSYNVAPPPSPNFHYGGIIKAHGGWYTPMISAGEQMIIAQRGEYITRRNSVNQETLPALDYINKTGSIPQQPINVIINLKGGAIDDPAYWDKIVRWYIQPAINRNSNRRV